MNEIKRDEHGVENMVGKKGTKVVAHGKIAFAELGTIAEKLKAAKGTENEAIVFGQYINDETGIYYDAETGSCGVADGFVIRDGYIVRG